jgi:hypothetical protein
VLTAPSEILNAPCEQSKLIWQATWRHVGKYFLKNSKFFYLNSISSVFSSPPSLLSSYRSFAHRKVRPVASVLCPPPPSCPPFSFPSISLLFSPTHLRAADPALVPGGAGRGWTQRGGGGHATLGCGDTGKAAFSVGFVVGKGAAATAFGGSGTSS